MLSNHRENGYASGRANDRDLHVRYARLLIKAVVFSHLFFFQ